MTPPRAGRPVAVGAALAGFVVLALTVTSSSALAAADTSLQRVVLAWRSGPATVLFEALTTLGTFPVVVGTALTGVVVLAVRTRSWVLPVVLAAGVALVALVIDVVKIGVARPRPPAADRIGAAPVDFAFPSGHTGDGTTAWVLTVVLVGWTVRRTVARRLVLVAALVVSAGIGLSRVYLGYHWPSDVVGSWLLAAALIGTATAVARRAGSAAGASAATSRAGVPDEVAR